MDFLAYKLNIEDLRACKPAYNEGSNWTLELDENRALDVQIVWLQGEVTEIIEESFKLEDSTGSCRVIAGPEKDLSIQSWMKPGVYCSVLGKLECEGAEPIIVAKKITNLSGNPVLKKMWPLEVAELRKVLCCKIIPFLLN